MLQCQPPDCKRLINDAIATEEETLGSRQPEGLQECSRGRIPTYREKTTGNLDSGMAPPGVPENQAKQSLAPPSGVRSQTHQAPGCLRYAATTDCFLAALRAASSRATFRANRCARSIATR